MTHWISFQEQPSINVHFCLMLNFEDMYESMKKAILMSYEPGGYLCIHIHIVTPTNTSVTSRRKINIQHKLKYYIFLIVWECPKIVFTVINLKLKTISNIFYEKNKCRKIKCQLEYKQIYRIFIIFQLL